MTDRIEDVTRYFLSIAGFRVHDDDQLEGLRKAKLALDRFPGVTLDEITAAFDRVTEIVAAREDHMHRLQARLDELRGCAIANPAEIRRLEGELTVALLTPIGEGGVSPAVIARRLDGGGHD